MMFEIETTEGISVLRLTIARLDAARAPAFRQEMEKARLPSPPFLVVDLQGVEFMDSTGLGAIINLFRQSKANGGELRVCGVTGGVATLFTLTRLNRMIGIYPDRQAALAGFPPGRP